MDFLVKFASAFMSVFQAGGANFVSWVTGIIPTILMLLVMMNAIIALIGDERIEVIIRSTPLGQRIHARQPDGPFHGQVHA